MINFLTIEMLFVFVIVAIITGAIASLIYWGLTPFRNHLINKGKLSKTSIKRIRWGIISVVILISIYQTYDAFYPSDAFYFDEFKKVTLTKAPKSAHVIRKSSTYPDLHGDYGSCSLIQLSKNDYKTLLASLKNDKKLEKAEIMISDEVTTVCKGIDLENAIANGFVRKNAGEEDRYYYIGFLKDGIGIIVHVSVT